MRRRRPPLPPPKQPPSFSNRKRTPRNERPRMRRFSSAWKRTRKGTTPLPRMKARRVRSTFPKRYLREEGKMVSVGLLAQALPSASSGVDWLYQFTNNLTNLTTQNGGALTQLGLTELACISLFVLISL